MQIHRLLLAAGLGSLIAATGAAAQTSTGLAPISSGNGAGLLGGSKAADTAAGSAVTKAGQVVVVGSGAHGGGPAPIVSGAVPATTAFTSSVTDGSGKVGKGMKGTGEAIARSGVTVQPSGAARGVEAAPGRLGVQARAAEGIPASATSGLGHSSSLTSATNHAEGDGLVTAGRVALVGSGAHGGGPAPIVSGTVPQTTAFTSGVTEGSGKIGKGMKSTGETVASRGIALSPSGAERGAAAAPANLAVQGGRAEAIAR